jgi:CheY-like chemotaxis protein
VSDRVRASVLVVDDEPTIAEVVARYLERAASTSSSSTSCFRASTAWR